MKLKDNHASLTEYRSDVLRRPSSAVRYLLLVLIVVFCAAAFSGCGGELDRKTVHSNYDEDEIYGKGDYVYSTVTFTGTGLGKEKILTVKEIEELACSSDILLGFQNTYSMLNDDGEFYSHRFTGVKLYDLLVYLGMDEELPDSTKVTVYGRSGGSSVLTVGEIKSHDYSRYMKGTDTGYDETDLAAILAFGSDSRPLVGPSGSDRDNRKFTEEDGYDKKRGNNGGPLRFIVGQKNRNDVNVGRCEKGVVKVVVGDETDYSIHDETDAKSGRKLKVNIYHGKKRVAQKSLSMKNIENFAAESDKNRVSGFYNSGAYYEGADLMRLLKKLGVKYSTGSILFRYQDSTSEILDLSYVMNRSGSYRSYVTERDGRTVTGLRPAIGFSKNGKPTADSSIMALLPKNISKKPGSSVKQIEEIDVVCETKGKGRYDNCRLNVNGSGVVSPKSYTVAELSEKLAKDIEMIDGYYDGVSLAGLLEKTGLTSDAASVTISNGEKSVTYDLNEILDYKIDAVIATKFRHVQIPGKRGPIVFRGEDDLDNVTSIVVNVENDEWNHFKKPYNTYLDVKLKISGSKVNKKTYTLKDIELLGYSGTVREEFTASEKNKALYQGVLLRKLIEDNLKSGEGYPDKITVKDYNGYKVEISVKDVFRGIESKKQTGEKRDVILAYSRDGEPLVPSKKSKGFNEANAGGPLCLIVENQGSKWMGVVTEIIVD